MSDLDKTVREIVKQEVEEQLRNMKFAFYPYTAAKSARAASEPQVVKSPRSVSPATKAKLSKASSAYWRQRRGRGR